MRQLGGLKGQGAAAALTSQLPGWPLPAAQGGWTLPVPEGVRDDCYEVTLVDAPQGFAAEWPGERLAASACAAAEQAGDDG